MNCRVGFIVDGSPSGERFRAGIFFFTFFNLGIDRGPGLIQVPRMSNTTRQPMPAESPATAALIFEVTGFKTGEDFKTPYQFHAAKLRVNTYVLHLPSGKAGLVNGIAIEETIECARPKFTRVYGIAYDCEYPAEVLRRITPKQYKALPAECKIVSGETGIF